MAINHRQKMDNKLGLLNGYYSDEINIIVKPISIDKVKLRVIKNIDDLIKNRNTKTNKEELILEQITV